MLPPPRRQEIDHRTLKRVVGVVAISLAFLTWLSAGAAMTSISAAYYAGGWSQSIFVGFLFAIAAFLLAYNGQSPCRRDGHEELVPYVHEGAATTMFLVLAYSCYGFLRSAWGKGHIRAKLRAAIYAVCGVAIPLSIVVLAYGHLFNRILTDRIPRLTFYGEATALVAFGISWLTAGRTLPLLTRATERFSPFGDRDPTE